MNPKKTKTILILSFILITSFSLDNLETFQLTATIDSNLQTISPLLTAVSLSPQCGQNQVQSIGHVCIKPDYIQGCQIYQTTSACSKCSAGYLLNKDKKCEYQSTFTGAITHILGCIKQSTDSCQVCAQGFYNKQNKCALGVKNCAYYNKDGQCTQCQHDYSLILSQCRKNSLLGCKYETESHTCQQCYAPFTLNGLHCDIDECRILNDYGCVSCECGYYLTTERNCKSIAPGCLRYEKGVCKDCISHYKLKGGMCQIEGCLEYTGNFCKNCADKYELIEGQCHFKNCNDWLNDQCINCKTGFGLKNGVCVTTTTISCS